MPTATSDARPSSRWSQERRLEFIDFRLRWDGRLNRADLTDFFGISVPQASLDIARYTELAPQNLSYDRSARVYLATPSFSALYETSSQAHYLDELLAHASSTLAGGPSGLGYRPAVAVLPRLSRLVSLDVLVALQRAMREGTGVRVRYQSLTRREPSERAITPHAFAHDGHRWHVRAYCHLRASFRDFVLGRFLSVEGTVPAGRPGTDDTAWHTMVKLELVPHPKLPATHRRAVALDYGMTDGALTIECRQAFLMYVLRHLRLDLSGQRPEEQQVVLKNAREVERARRQAENLAAPLTPSTGAETSRRAVGTRRPG
jgi:predicted DNA-binding transcriptional regulator YafY